MEYDLTKDEMLDILAELAQGEHIWRSSKNELLNFIEEIREQQQSMTFLEKLAHDQPEKLDFVIDDPNSCPWAFGYEDHDPEKTCMKLTCVECWLRKE